MTRIFAVECQVKGCQRSRMDGSPFCADHTGEALAVASASQSNEAVNAEALCEAPACYKPAAIVWEGMELCAKHGRYADLTKSVDAIRRSRDVSWLVSGALLALAVALAVLR